MHIRGRKLAFIAALFAAVFLLSPTPAKAFSWSTWWNPRTWFTPATQYTGSVSGMVTVGGNSPNPINVVAVSVDGKPAPLSSTGSYSMTVDLGSRVTRTNVPVKFDYVAAPKPSEPSKTFYVTVNANRITPQSHNFATPVVNNVAEVRGTVRDTSKNVVANSRVTVDGTDVYTNSSGVYARTVPLGTATSKYLSIVFACLPSSPAYWRTEHATPPANDAVDFGLCPVSSSGGGGGGGTETGIVTGTIKDKTGAIEKGAAVTVDGTRYTTNAITGIFTTNPITGVRKTVLATYACFGGADQSTNVSVAVGTTTVAWLCTTGTGGGGGTPPPTSTGGTYDGYAKISDTGAPLSDVKVTHFATTNTSVDPSRITNTSGYYQPVSIVGASRQVTVTFTLTDTAIAAHPTLQRTCTTTFQYINATNHHNINCAFIAAADPPQTTSLHGKVTSGKDNFPEGGITVTVYQPSKENPTLIKTTTTEKGGYHQGEYLFDNNLMAGQKAVVTAEDSLHKTASTELILQKDGSGNIADLLLRFDSYGNQILVDVNLDNHSPQDPGTLVAKIFDRNNRLIDTAMLYLYSNNGRNYFSGASNRRIIFAGTYRVELWTGTSDRARNIGSAQSVTFDEENAQKKLVVFNLVSLPALTAHLEVYVKALSIPASSDGRLIVVPGAAVVLKDSKSTVIRRSLTDGSGHLVFDLNLAETTQLTGGDSSITTTAAGYRDAFSRIVSFGDSDWYNKSLLVTLNVGESDCVNHPSLPDFPEIWTCGGEANAMYPNGLHLD
ncbi:MAG: hypothetical protein Q7S80_01900, partial [bacterium]|nr:hypothetical protein [bacterium]